MSETVDCHRCGGCGELDASGFPCPQCQGKGYYPSCNAHELIYEDGSGHVCRHCGKDLSYEPDDED